MIVTFVCISELHHENFSQFTTKNAAKKLYQLENQQIKYARNYFIAISHKAFKLFLRGSFRNDAARKKLDIAK